MGYTRSNIYGKNFDESIKENNPLIIAQIENINAVNNINEILLVDGLDAVIIGPYDLSASIDRTGEFSSAEYVSLIKKIRSLYKKQYSIWLSYCPAIPKKFYWKKLNRVPNLLPMEPMVFF